jgi:hypothetical protein
MDFDIAIQELAAARRVADEAQEALKRAEYALVVVALCDADGLVKRATKRLRAVGLKWTHVTLLRRIEADPKLRAVVDGARARVDYPGEGRPPTVNDGPGD